MALSLYGSNVDAPASKWTSLTAFTSPDPRWNPVCSGTSLWLSSCSKSRRGKGMIEFCCISNSFKKAIPFPNGISGGDVYSSSTSNSTPPTMTNRKNRFLGNLTVGTGWYGFPFWCNLTVGTGWSCHFCLTSTNRYQP